MMHVWDKDRGAQYARSICMRLLAIDRRQRDNKTERQQGREIRRQRDKKTEIRRQRDSLLAIDTRERERRCHSLPEPYPLRPCVSVSVSVSVSVCLCVCVCARGRTDGSRRLLLPQSFSYCDADMCQFCTKASAK